MRKLIIIFIVVNIIVTIFILIVNRQTLPTITYFPLHETITIHDGHTTLKAIPTDHLKNFILDWTIFSQTQFTIYLRQDISLLYENGYLLGIINKWQTDTNKLRVEKQFERPVNSLYQAISFHYGEIHEQDQSIKSIQKMTYDQLYVIDCQSCDEILSFQQGIHHHEKSAVEDINKQISRNLDQSWKRLINYFGIDKQKYLALPLADLAIFEGQPIPHLTQQETNQVIGQLWEGLYKNYVVPLSQTKMSSTKNYMPLILMDKQGDHLIILFEIEGKPEQLIQKISKANQ